MLVRYYVSELLPSRNSIVCLKRAAGDHSRRQALAGVKATQPAAFVV
jgi:hypothetical protein